MSRICMFAVVALLVAQAAFATDYTWSAGNGAWGVATSWGGAGFPNNLTDTAYFSAAAAQTAQTDSGGPFKVGNITFGNGSRLATSTVQVKIGGYTGTGGVIEVAANSTITQNDPMSATYADKFNAKLQLDGATTFNGAAAGGYIYTYGLTGSGGVVKDGPGYMQFEAYANTNTGLTWIKAGRLNLDLTKGMQAIGAGGLKMTGGRLQYASGTGGGNNIDDTCPLDLSGGAELTLAGASETVGVLTLSGNATGWGNNNGLDAVHFANSSAATWAPGAVFTITTYNASLPGKYYFGTDTTGLTADQLAQVRFVDGVTSAVSPAMWDPSGSGLVVPAPEPMTISLLVVGGLALLRRKA